ncbi:MAG TPA: sigma 54-interacting transcriptional regulator [Gemmatimonadaceae bacterium]|nr:sigma 54-interacting transcriptional regulator [Gemmatimonadaceae bacterium]
MPYALSFTEGAGLVDVAKRINRLSIEHWGERKPTMIVGRHETVCNALAHAVRFAPCDSPVLLTGETGTGKELFARALYLLSARKNRPFLSVNCAQYHDGQLIASELFGHRRGSFTGAVADHRGLFEEADGGVVFLDEVGELSVPAQAMLLRALSEGEVVPVGSSHAKNVDVRVIAATARDLKPMVDAGRFRADLYYRLRYLHVHVPAVRERGDDWQLIAGYYLNRLSTQRATRKSFSPDALKVMEDYHWPGNVRELKSIVDMGFHLSSGETIDACDFAHELEVISRQEQMRRVPLLLDASVLRPMVAAADAPPPPPPLSSAAGEPDPLARMAAGESFWEVVHRPFMDREMSRVEARAVVTRGLDRTRGSYKKLLDLFGVPQDDYLKFMDFLRHQKLKPE